MNPKRLVINILTPVILLLVYFGLAAVCYLLWRQNVLATLVFDLIILVFGGGYLLRRYFKNLAYTQSGLASRLALRELPLWSILAVVILLIGNGTQLFFVQILHLSSHTGGQEVATVSKSWEVLVYLLLVVIIAPICEEIFFRGIFYNSVARVFGPRNGEICAVLITSVIFTVIHGVGRIVPIFLLAILLAMLRYRLVHLWVCMVIHVIYNLASVLFAGVSLPVVFYQLAPALYLVILLVVGHYILKQYRLEKGLYMLSGVCSKPLEDTSKPQEVGESHA